MVSSLLSIRSSSSTSQTWITDGLPSCFRGTDFGLQFVWQGFLWGQSKASSQLRSYTFNFLPSPYPPPQKMESHFLFNLQWPQQYLRNTRNKINILWMNTWGISDENCNWYKTSGKKFGSLHQKHYTFFLSSTLSTG